VIDDGLQHAAAAGGPMLRRLRLAGSRFPRSGLRGDPGGFWALPTGQMGLRTLGCRGAVA
jgi:hypothetical protein